MGKGIETPTYTEILRLACGVLLICCACLLAPLYGSHVPVAIVAHAHFTPGSSPPSDVLAVTQPSGTAVELLPETARTAAINVMQGQADAADAPIQATFLWAPLFDMQTSVLHGYHDIHLANLSGPSQRVYIVLPEGFWDPQHEHISAEWLETIANISQRGDKSLL
ncbi:hypothetical protein WJX72_009997 [[Myrmecia] bisecta]|uniref:Uncharacterized protein n=1 Tax=[Myrmecia] bisecta TaxID=41462 RepID=A0AAW1PI06_9CHLO